MGIPVCVRIAQDIHELYKSIRSRRRGKEGKGNMVRLLPLGQSIEVE